MIDEIELYVAGKQHLLKTVLTGTTMWALAQTDLSYLLSFLVMVVISAYWSIANAR